MNLDTTMRVEYKSGGGFNSVSPGRFYTLPGLQVFYPAAIAVGFDVAYGPCEELRLPLRPASRGKLEDLELEIIAIEQVSVSGASNGRPIKRSGNRETRALLFELDPEREPRTQIVFSLSAPEVGGVLSAVAPSV